MVSVVILSMSPPQYVLDCLEGQSYKDFEIIVASEKGIVKAMNKALEKAKGDILVRIDDDVDLPCRWLEELVTPLLSDPMLAGSTGPTFVPQDLRDNRDSIRWAEKPNWFLRWLYDNGEFNPGGIRKCGCVSYDSNFMERFKSWELFEPDHLEGTNWAMRTQLIRAVGGFDSVFDGVSEWFDTDVEAKIKKLGHRLIYNPRAYMYHLLKKGDQFHERFEGFSRMDNWLLYHHRHSKFHWKMIVYLIVWGGYFIWKRLSR